jgi:hypothetical protein
MWDMQLVFIILCPCTNVKFVSYSNEHLMHVQYTQNCMNSHIQEDVCPLLISRMFSNKTTEQLWLYV